MKVTLGRRRQQTVLVDNDNSGGLTFGQFLLLMIVLVALFVFLWEWILKDIFFPPEPTASATVSGTPQADFIESYNNAVALYDNTLIAVFVVVVLMLLIPLPLRLFLDLNPVVLGYVIGGVVFLQCVSGTIMFITTFNVYQKGRDAWPNDPNVVAEAVSWEGNTIACASFLLAGTVAMVGVFFGGAALPGVIAFFAWLFFFVVPLIFLIWYIVSDYDDYYEGDGLMILMVTTTAVNGILLVLLMLKAAEYTYNKGVSAKNKAKEKIEKARQDVEDMWKKLRQTEQKLAELGENTYERERLELQAREENAEIAKAQAEQIDDRIDDII